MLYKRMFVTGPIIVDLNWNLYLYPSKANFCKEDNLWVLVDLGNHNHWCFLVLLMAFPPPFDLMLVTQIMGLAYGCCILIYLTMSCLWIVYSDFCNKIEEADLFHPLTLTLLLHMINLLCNNVSYTIAYGSFVVPLDFLLCYLPSAYVVSDGSHLLTVNNYLL